jgi:hypothetical protein
MGEDVLLKGRGECRGRGDAVLRCDGRTMRRAKDIPETCLCESDVRDCEG